MPVSDPLADLQRRAREAEVIANRQSLPARERVLQVLQAFSGTWLTGLPPKVHRDMERHFAAVNLVLAKYHLERNEDYERMTKADLQEILDIVLNSAAKVARAK